MTACVVCGCACIPMADHEQPCCYECDERMAAILAIGPLPTVQRSAAVLPFRDLFDQLRTEIGAA